LAIRLGHSPLLSTADALMEVKPVPRTLIERSTLICLINESLLKHQGGLASRRRSVCRMFARPEPFVSEFCRAEAGRWTGTATFFTAPPPKRPSTLSAHLLHTGRGTTSLNPRSRGPGWLMPDQPYSCPVSRATVHLRPSAGHATGAQRIPGMLPQYPTMGPGSPTSRCYSIPR
jgi:hypothetical protein